MSVLTVNEVTKTFKKKKSMFSDVFSTVHALSDISMRFDTKGIYSIVGESGCGKTTIARIIAGLETPTTGTIVLNDEIRNAAKMSRRSAVRKDVQLGFQNPYASMNPRFLIFDVLSEGLRNFKVKKADAKERVSQIVREVNLPPDIVYAYPHELSGGERQRVALARAFFLLYFVYLRSYVALLLFQQNSFLLTQADQVNFQDLAAHTLSYPQLSITTCYQ